MEHKTHSNWVDFIRDFGDAIGGICIGYGVADHHLSYALVGTVLILLSIYLRFYSHNSNQQL